MPVTHALHTLFPALPGAFSCAICSRPEREIILGLTRSVGEARKFILGLTEGLLGASPPDVGFWVLMLRFGMEWGWMGEGGGHEGGVWGWESRDEMPDAGKIGGGGVRWCGWGEWHAR